jgi:hypothetical protein
LDSIYFFIPQILLKLIKKLKKEKAYREEGSGREEMTVHEHVAAYAGRG